MSIEFSLTLTMGQIANALAAQRPPLPLRVCGFCENDIPWGTAISERYQQDMHRDCATAFDAASQRILSQAERLGYREGECAWCRRPTTTLRYVNHPPAGNVCGRCRGVREGESEGL